MILDSAIETFLETFDRDAIMSIDNFSKDELEIRNKAKISLFGITEAFNRFDQIISNWGKTNLRKLIKEGTDYTLQDASKEVSDFINLKIIKPKEVLVSDLPAFVESYLTGVKKTLDNIENIKIEMIKNKINNENIGIINDFADHFMEKVNTEFFKGMDTILWATGYNVNAKRKKQEEEFTNIII